jgi:hypothetical protein
LAKNTLVGFTSDNGGDKLSRNGQLAKGKRMKKLLDKWEGQVDPPLYPVSSKGGD